MADPRFHISSGAKHLSELASLVEGELQGDDCQIQDVAPLDTATINDISFFDNIKYKEDFMTTKAGACIVSAQMVEFAPKGCALLVSNTPYKSYALIAQAFYPVKTPPTQIVQSASVAKTAVIGEGCFIGAGAVILEGVILGANTWIEPNSVIGDNVEIGQNCRIGAGTVVSHTIIGDYTRLYPNVSVGQDGFGFAIDPAGHVKVPQLGRVIIGDHVEIGASTCIDRGAGPDTIIGNGVWIDNLVQLGHNVKIGNGCVIVAQVGIAGSTTLEDYVVVAAQVGIAGHLTIGMGTRIGAQSGVMRNLPAGSEVMGAPSVPKKQFMRQVATLKKLTQPMKK